MGKLSARDIFKHVMAIEDEGEKFYQTLSQVVTVESLQKAFLLMSKQEQEHRKTYQAFIDDIQEADAASASDRDTVTEMFDETHFEALKDKIFNRLENVKKVSTLKTLGDALNYMIDIECDVVDLFEKLQSLVRTDEKAKITRIINEERSHVQQLMALRRRYRSMSLKQG